jgi:hypothetical protein
MAAPDHAVNLTDAALTPANPRATWLPAYLRERTIFGA